MPVHILAGAAVLGLAVASGARLEAWWIRRTDRGAILARITLPTQVAVDQTDEWGRRMHRYLNTACVQVDVETDEWGGRHYSLKKQPIAPVTAPHASIVHLVDTQPYSAVTATRPMLPAVKGNLRRARFYDIGRAG